MKPNQFTSLVLLLFFFIFQLGELMAGPGGKIAKSLFDSPIGKIVGIILVIVFLPFIIYSMIKERIGMKKTMKDLDTLAVNHPRQFDWLNIKSRATDVFGRVHNAWSNGDMSESKDYMTEWYWQNQQMVFLDKWEREGLVNKCDVKKVIEMKPLMVRTTNEENFDGSRVVLSIEANMEDYLMEKESGRIVEGVKGYKNRKSVWTLMLENNLWKVENIEQEETVGAYLKMPNVIPAQPMGQQA